MSQENVEVVRRAVEAWNARDAEGFVELFDPDAEVIFPPEVPEPGPFHGQAEIMQWTEGFLAAWDQYHASIEELIEAGHDVVAVLHQQGRGRGSDLETDETDAHVFTISEGKVRRWRNYGTREEALEAVGLSE